ncbi:MAG: hypothetical protein FWC22_01005 [Treponema sp.]|nr:hypothetical protein [Treponema sp.]
MKRTIRLLEAIRSIAVMRNITIIAMVTVIGFSMVACGAGSSEKKLNGSWAMKEKTGGWFELNDGKYEYSDNWKGSYKINGSTIKFTQTHSKFGETDWYEEKDELSAQIIDDNTFRYFGSDFFRK